MKQAKQRAQPKPSQKKQMTKPPVSKPAKAPKKKPTPVRKPPMARPSNEDLYNKDPEIEGGENAAITTAAVTAALAHYPNQEAKALEAKTVSGIGHVTVGYKATDGVHIVEVTVDAMGVVTPGEERKDQHPGHGKPDKVEHEHGHSAEHRKHK
jgi:hypothetical protein